MNMIDRDRAAQAIINTCLRMNALGINQGKAGNVSMRFDSGFLITPSGVSYGALTERDMVLVTPDGDSHGPLQPSSEWRMHRDIYLNHKEAQAIVHAHPPHATALACQRKGIPAFHYMVAVAGGRNIRCAEYATFGTAVLSELMLDALDGRRACLLANHGLIAYGVSLDGALDLAVEVEALAQQYLLACQSGKPVLLTENEMDDVLEKFKTYGKPPASKA